MNTKKVISIVGLTVILFSCWRLIEASYPWPLEPQDESHAVKGTFCEFREKTDKLPYHFHTGVDIKASLDDTVYSVAGGKITNGGFPLQSQLSRSDG